MKLPFLTVVFVSVSAVPCLAQWLAVATRSPSGGLVAAPGPVHVLFPVGDLSLPIEVRLTPPSGLASFLARLAPATTTDVVGISHELDLHAHDHQGHPLVYATTFDGIRSAPQAFDLLLASQAQAPVQGTLRIAVRTTASAFDGSASGRSEVDVDGDRVADIVVDAPVRYWPVTRSFVRELPYTLQPQAVQALTLWTEGAVSAWSTVGYGHLAAEVRIEFAKGAAATSVTHGAGCGLSIEGWFESDASSENPSARRTVQVAMRGASPFAPVLLVLGSDRSQLPVPGTNCKLATNPLVTLPLTADAAGAVEIRTDLQDAVLGDVSFQYWALGAGAHLAATQGLSLRLH